MKIKEKLRSSKGASLIIALVFMLFCAMVGSAVLAAATANGGRIAALKSDQQEYLDQRSAATLLSDELQINTPKLIVTKKQVVTTTYKVGDGGVLKQLNSQETDTVDFAVSSPVTTQLQRVLFESAIMRYIEENGMEDYYKNDPIIISGFAVAGADGSADQNITKLSDFIMYDKAKSDKQDPKGTLKVGLSEGTVGNGTPVNSFTAEVGCAGSAAAGKEETVAPYTFNVSFGNDSKLYLRMYAAMSQPRTITVHEQTAGDSSDTLVNIDTTTITQTISWDAPEVLKGAAKWNA